MMSLLPKIINTSIDCLCDYTVSEVVYFNCLIFSQKKTNKYDLANVNVYGLIL